MGRNNEIKKMSILKIKHLEPSFYAKNKGSQYLRVKSGRGYGVVEVKINGYTFGIPLHSNIKRGAGFILGVKNKNYTGLDYNKAVIIKDAQDLGRTFKIPPSQLTKIRKNETLIIEEFQKFIREFIYRTKIGDQNVLSRTYKNSTLHYYKNELTTFTPVILNNPLQTLTK